MAATHTRRSRWIAKSGGPGLDLTIQAEQMACCGTLADRTELLQHCCAQERGGARTPGH